MRLFIASANNCEYLLGEWDNHLAEARKKEIERQVDKYCGEAKEMKEKLKIKYKGDVDIEDRLDSFDFY